MKATHKYLINIIVISILLNIGLTAFGKKKVEGFHYGIKIPFSYNFGYYSKVANRFGFYANATIVTVPFNNSLLGYMKAFGADEKMTNVLIEPFRFGFGFEGGGHYYFGTDNRRYYVGLNAQWINLPKVAMRDEVINEAYGVDLSSHDYPEGPITEAESKNPLTLKSAYMQMGIMAGKRFFYLEPNFEMFLEVGLSKTMASTHRLASDYRYISPVSELNNESLKKMMKRYGWMPTVNVFFIYKFH